MSCNNKVETYVVTEPVDPEMPYDKVVELPCGSTGPNGKILQCDECAAKDKKPLKWDNLPWDDNWKRAERNFDTPNQETDNE